MLTGVGMGIRVMQRICLMYINRKNSLGENRFYRAQIPKWWDTNQISHITASKYQFVDCIAEEDSDMMTSQRSNAEKDTYSHPHAKR